VLADDPCGTAARRDPVDGVKDARDAALRVLILLRDREREAEECVVGRAQEHVAGERIGFAFSVVQDVRDGIGVVEVDEDRRVLGEAGVEVLLGTRLDRVRVDALRARERGGLLGAARVEVDVGDVRRDAGRFIFDEGEVRDVFARTAMRAEGDSLDALAGLVGNDAHCSSSLLSCLLSCCATSYVLLSCCRRFP
jgi:hypothetical protein